MRNILVFCLCLLWSVGVSAHSIECPRADAIERPKIPEDCKNKSFLRLLGEKNFARETSEIQKMLDKTHHDNISNPEYIVDDGNKELRLHHQCLDQICRAVFGECMKTPELEGVDAKGEYDWCIAKANQLIELQKTKFDYVATGNQARKERALLAEKFSEIHEKFADHIQDRMSNLLIAFRRFEVKVDKLIKWPKRSLFGR